MSDTIRIRTTPDGADKYIKTAISQDFDFIEILSLKISQEDVYRKFCSDYGVVVGRVSINNGFGVPNAKVSVFIPLDEVDKLNPEIRDLYPYETVNDKNSDGVRYNLLPEKSQSEDDCYTPIGSFKDKRVVLDNDVALEVYCKYYKFTTTTNAAGDFMFFGVPLGTYTVHVDADISDIGIATQKPYDLISQGTPEKLFDSSTKFKSGVNIDKLVQVKTLNAGVNVQPFWGDVENCEVGISRVDFDLNYNIQPSAIFMGSIFGDSEKNSVNKHCRPRKKLGQLCEQVAGTGSVDMIRKTIGGDIEEFSVNGGRVIDDEGTWAYQIPMNLDYMVTDEFGNLVLSNDPNRGIPTRASVRFKIGMDETGGSGRLRTRAKYLVPNNPANPSEVDYEFGEDTKDSSFRDLYWNKIYSVSNFITRFQRDGLFSTKGTRGMVGIKDVDDCSGVKTEFPYNRVNTSISPIFFILCLIIKIIVFLVWILNNFVIRILNFMINLINNIFKVICRITTTIANIICALPGTGSNCKKSLCLDPYWNGSSCDCARDLINPIPCIYVKCPIDGGSTFAPGCTGGSYGFAALVKEGITPTHFENDGDGHKGINNSGLDDCIAFEMAKALEVFQFDFYNDWVNGSLFSFLLKYRKKKKGREVFCEYDCDDWGIQNGGVDGNNNGKPDNRCQKNILMDTMFPDPNNKNAQNEYRGSGTIKDGVIKKIDGDFIYAATTHNLSLKLFATEIISLGSVFDCDWQGIPKIQQLLEPSSYKIPPDIAEYDEDNLANLETCGMVSINKNGSGGLFFEIDCLGVHVPNKGALNVRHICEFGVNIDESQEDPITGAFIKSADCIIGSDDIDDDGGKLFRDVFYDLNINGPNVNNFTPLPLNGFTTNFNIGNQPIYDFTSPSDNGFDYLKFRGLPVGGNDSYQQPKHSYYFYFGLTPGKTALDKLNERFFAKCPVVTAADIRIKASSTNVSIIGASDGTITFTIIGGVAPYRYSIVGVNGTSYQLPVTGTITTITNGPITISGLQQGTYRIDVTDGLDYPASKTVVVPNPLPLYCSVKVNKNATASLGGEIIINGVGGGLTGTTNGYTYIATDKNNNNVGSGSITTIPTIIGGLVKDMTTGYKVVVSDGSTPPQTCVTTGLTIDGPIPTFLTVIPKHVTCYNGNDGGLQIQVSGGQPPYTIDTNGPNVVGNPTLNLSNLVKGTYVTTITDILNTSLTATTVLNELTPQLLLTVDNNLLSKQCSTTSTTIRVKCDIVGWAPSPITVIYSVDGGADVFVNGLNSSTWIDIVIPATINTDVDIKFKSNSTTLCVSNIITIPKAQIVLPSAQLALNTTGIVNSQCTPSLIDIDVNIVGGFGPYTINYSATTSTLQTTTSSTTPVNLLIPVTSPNNTVYVEIIDSVGCSAVLTPFNVTLPTQPLTSVPYIGGFPIINPIGLQGYIYANAIGGTPPYNYFWSPAPGGNYGPSIHPGNAGGTFTVVVTDSNGCISTGTVTK